MEVYIQNWRCVEELKLQLGRVNVFMGPNGSGKSSAAYAIYLAARAPRDPETFIAQLYGNGFDFLARNVYGRAQYPVVVRLGDAEIRLEEDGTASARGAGGEAYLLPAKRLAYIQLALAMYKAAMMKSPVEASHLIGIYADVLKAMPPLPVFFSDLMRAVAGIKIEPQKGAAVLALKAAAMLSKYRDQHVELPIGLAPEGLIDFAILDAVASGRMPRKALLVVEEPEIHKNPLKVMEYVERLVKVVEEKDATVIATTHSDVVVLTLAKLVAQHRLKPEEDVKVYYFVRDPWTRAEEVKIYPDGTVEKLPDWEEATVALL
jgi:predicted ATPase